MNKQQLNESPELKNVIKRLPEVAFLTSLTQSKTLTILLILFITMFGGFALFFLNIAAI